MFPIIEHPVDGSEGGLQRPAAEPATQEANIQNRWTTSEDRTRDGRPWCTDEDEGGVRSEFITRWPDDDRRSTKRVRAQTGEAQDRTEKVSSLFGASQ